MDSHDEDDCAPTAEADRKARIAEINDQFRRDRKGGYVCLTNAVAALGYEASLVILEAIASFAEFTPDNDPHGERDYGALSMGANCFFWKIDCIHPVRAASGLVSGWA